MRTRRTSGLVVADTFSKRLSPDKQREWRSEAQVSQRPLRILEHPHAERSLAFMQGRLPQGSCVTVLKAESEFSPFPYSAEPPA